MKSKSSRNLAYAGASLLFLAIFWSALSYLFTDFHYLTFTKQIPWLVITIVLSWLLVLAKLRKNEITISSTQELILYIIAFPAISTFSFILVKAFNYYFHIQVVPYLLGSVIIAALSWMMLRLHETIEFSFGRKVKIHSKLTDEQFHNIRQSLVDTRLENHIDLKRQLTSHDQVVDYDLLIVSNISDIDNEIISAHLAGVKIESYDNFLISLHGKISTEKMSMPADYFSLKRLNPLVLAYVQLKSLVEPILALLTAIALAPVMLVVAIAVKLTSQGPAIFKQVRTGNNGKLFTLYKFRTMRTDAEVNGPKWWTPEDSRVTSVGKVLRATHLDELPQLLNVVLGDMGFVGPRPELPEFYQTLKQDIPHFELRTLIKPGITGWAQIKGGYANSVEYFSPITFIRFANYCRYSNW